MKKTVFAFTRQGCEISLAAIGTSFTITIKQKTGHTDTFVCGQDEAREIATMIHDLIGKEEE